ncbi:reverse transcriptase domain-containing protein [Tanacetum coccineum]
MDQKVRVSAIRKAENKRRWESNQGNNHVQQPLPKRQNVARAYIAGLGEKKAYAGNFPSCNKCKLYHVGPCTMKCSNCKRVGHMTGDCRTPILVTTQRAPVANQKLGIENLGEEHMHWEDEKPTKTLMSLRGQTINLNCDDYGHESNEDDNNNNNNKNDNKHKRKPSGGIGNKKAKCWKYFIPKMEQPDGPDGPLIKMEHCKFCPQVYRANSVKNGTKNMNLHYPKCDNNPMNEESL